MQTPSKRLSHDEYFLSMLQLVASRSTCIRRAVGAIIVDEKHHVLSTGYNGVPSGFPHCIDKQCAGALDPPGVSFRCLAVHAEVNAVLQCPRIGLAHTLYVSCAPCFSCAKMICNTPLKRIVCLEPYADDSSWLFAKAGIKLEIGGQR